MLTDFYATKLGMTQAWTKSGKRVAVTRCKADDLAVLGVLQASTQSDEQTLPHLLEVGVGDKKFKNVAKPLRSRLEKAGLTAGIASVRTAVIADPSTAADESGFTAGAHIAVEQIFAVGDVVQVQGVTKGRGFAGAVKRHGFHGGPKTHGQSDRTRAVGSIGAGTTPGRVIKGKRMPGHFGTDTQTVKGLTIVHLDPEANEVWLSGPVPGAIRSAVRIRKTGETKSIELDLAASGVNVPVAEQTPVESETTQEESQA